MGGGRGDVVEGELGESRKWGGGSAMPGVKERT